MKCIYCGAEIREGSLFCSNCGKAVQIVPDYNVYDEDYLNHVIASENNKGTTTKTKSKKANDARLKKRKRKIILAVLAVILMLVMILLVLGAAIRSDQNNSYSYQVEQARKAYNSGDLDKAIQYYEKALSLDMSSKEVRLALADIYEEKGDTNSALVLYQEILNLDNKNKESVKRLIAIYDKEGNTDAILALYESVDDSMSEYFSDYMVSEPVFDLEEGTYDSEQELTISADGDYDIYYTKDGGDPTVQGIHYSGPIELDENDKTYTIKAVCVNSKKIYSEVVEKEYTIEFPPPDMPIVTPDGGDFGVETTVTVTVPDGCTAYYTWSSSTPTKNSTRYTGPITIPEGNNVLSVILYDNKTGLSSEVYRGNYIFYDEDYSGEDLEDEEQ